MTGDWRDVVVWPTTFVIAEEEYRVFPLRTGHKCVQNLRHRTLSSENRLTGTGVFVIDAGTRLNEGKTRQSAVAEVCEIGGQGCNVGRINAEGVGNVPNYTGWFSAASAGGLRGVFVDVVVRESEIFQICCRVICVECVETLIEAEAIRHTIVDFP